MSEPRGVIMMNQNSKPQITEIIDAMKSPTKWDTYRVTQARKIAGKIEKTKSEQFAEYVDGVFMSVCEELNVFDMARDWAKKSAPEKLAVAGNIIKRFVERVQSDTQTGRAKKYNDKVVESVPKISVSRATDGQMSVSPRGAVNVNPNFRYYDNLINFLMDLRHESTHIVDMFFPSISPLDMDIRDLSMAFYIKPQQDFNLYKQNPLELNANMRRREFGNKLQEKIAVCEYARVQRLVGNAVARGIPRGR